MKLLFLFMFLLSLVRCEHISDEASSRTPVYPTHHKRVKDIGKDIAKWFHENAAPYLILSNENASEADIIEISIHLSKFTTRPAQFHSVNSQGLASWQLFLPNLPSPETWVEKIGTLSGLIKSVRRISWKKRSVSRSTDIEWLVMPKDPENQDEVANTRAWLNSKVLNQSEIQEHKQSGVGNIIFWSGVTLNDDALKEAREYEGISLIEENSPINVYRALSPKEITTTEPISNEFDLTLNPNHHPDSLNPEENVTLEKREKEPELKAYTIFPENPGDKVQMAKTREWLESRFGKRTGTGEDATGIYEYRHPRSEYWGGVFMDAKTVKEVRELEGIAGVSERKRMRKMRKEVKEYEGVEAVEEDPEFKVLQKVPTTSDRDPTQLNPNSNTKNNLSARKAEQEYLIVPKNPGNEEEMAELRAWLESKFGKRGKGKNAKGLSKFRDDEIGFWSHAVMDEETAKEIEAHEGIEAVVKDPGMSKRRAHPPVERSELNITQNRTFPSKLSRTRRGSLNTSKEFNHPRPQTPKYTRQCNGIENKRYIFEPTLSELIDNQFCPEAVRQNSHDLNQSGITRTYLKGTNQEVDIHIYFPSRIQNLTDVSSLEKCKHYLHDLLRYCDYTFPVAWKAGGRVYVGDMSKNGVKYMITPKPLRADLFTYPEAKCIYSKKPTPQDPNNVLYTVTRGKVDERRCWIGHCIGSEIATVGCEFLTAK